MRTTLYAFLALALLAGERSPKPLLDPGLSWHGENRDRLERFIRSASHADGAGTRRPVAVFDWDNTVIKNDVGDALVFWMVSHDAILRPADWKLSSPFLSPEAVNALNQACPASLPNPLPTSTHPECADAILSVYAEGPWSKDFNKDTMEPAYAWAVQLTSGHTPDEVRRFAAQAIAFNLGGALGAEQKIGSRSYPAYLRVYPQIRDLISALQKNRFDVWVVSASSQYAVEVFANHVGVDKKRVIGVRPVLDAKGRITPVFEGCGTHPKGSATLITYRQGKRCWINQGIFGLKDGTEMMEKPGPIAFGAGDSDTDFFFLKDATGLRLAINRNKRELMCAALANTDGKWLVNPMFIEPKPTLAKGYSCGEFGLPDQKD